MLSNDTKLGTSLTEKSSDATRHSLASTSRALSIVDFCREYGLSKSSFYKLANSGKLRTVRIAGRHLVPRDEAEKLLEG